MKYALIALILVGCSMNTGPHVDYRTIIQPSLLKWECRYSDHWFSWDRVIAVCDKQEECNDICGKLK